MNQDMLDIDNAPGLDVPHDLLWQRTPLEMHGGVLCKRDDLFSAYGAPGGKARTCLAILAGEGTPGGVAVTASSRHSPQAAIVAMIAEGLGLTHSKVHTPDGPSTPELELAERHGAVRVPHRPGYNSVIMHRAMAEAAQHHDYCHVPFGMACWEAVRQTARSLSQTQIQDAERLVVAVGSGMSLAGILHGLGEDSELPILGVQVGADPTVRLDTYAPRDWRNRVTLARASVPYEAEVEARLGDLLLDPVYEAKCVPYLEKDDLFWIVGIRPSLVGTR